MALSKKWISVAEVALIQATFSNVVLSKDKNEHTECYGIFTPFKSQVYSEHGSTNFLLFSSWILVLYLHISVKANFFLITLTKKIKLSNILSLTWQT